MVEVVVARLGLDSSTDSHVVILREKDGFRFLPIWIGLAEAHSIAVFLSSTPQSRPFTHDLFRSLVESLGGSVRRVNISRLESNTYFAEMIVDGPAGIVEVDARPSDSIAIALRCGSPIFAEASLLIDPDDSDTEGPDPFDGDEPPGVMDAESLKEHLERLRPEDFGRFRL